jgi:hypothetical protein
MEELRTKTADGMQQKLACFAIFCNLTHSEMVAEAILRKLPENLIGITSAMQRLHDRTVVHLAFRWECCRSVGNAVRYEFAS